MTPILRPATSHSHTTGFIQWIFRKGHQLLFCDVIKTGGEYSVQVVPCWNRGSAAIESFGRAAPALQRHAELSRFLRESGWVAEVDARRISVAAIDGKVILSGSVHSWAERQQVEHAAWAAPGVKDVEDRLAIVP